MSAQTIATTEIVEKSDVKVLVAREIHASRVDIICPQCGLPQPGWHADPRGIQDQCEDCGTTYRVAEDALVKFN